MYKVHGKVTDFTVIDNLKKEPPINKKLTPKVVADEFDKHLDKRGKVTPPRHSSAIEPRAIQQTQNICSQPLAKNTKVVLQSDCHFGDKVSIGTTIKLLTHDSSKLAVAPSVISGDIGCGVLATKVDVHRLDLHKLDKVVEQTIPAAFHTHIYPIDAKYSMKIASQLDMPVTNVVKRDLLHSLGTLGAGNHFLELDKDKHGDFWLVIHSGSRHFGTDIMKYYLQEANDEGQDKFIHQGYHIADFLKKRGKSYYINDIMHQFYKMHPVVKKPYACVRGKLLEEYLHDTVLGQKFAVKNRHLITDIVLTKMHWHIMDQFQSIHNYFDPRDNTIRKGAISAHKNERLVIPLNMRDGSIFAIGKGSKAFNYSCPHGAGRQLSRSMARHELNMTQFKKDMHGIYSSSIDKFTLDEAPEAYKPYTQITNNITPSAKIIDRVKPIYNYKDHMSNKRFKFYEQLIHGKHGIPEEPKSENEDEDKSNK